MLLEPVPPTWPPPPLQPLPLPPPPPPGPSFICLKGFHLRSKISTTWWAYGGVRVGHVVVGGGVRVTSKLGGTTSVDERSPPSNLSYPPVLHAPQTDGGKPTDKRPFIDAIALHLASSHRPPISPLAPARDIYIAALQSIAALGPKEGGKAAPSNNEGMSGVNVCNKCSYCKRTLAIFCCTTVSHILHPALPSIQEHDAPVHSRLGSKEVGILG